MPTRKLDISPEHQGNYRQSRNTGSATTAGHLAVRSTAHERPKPRSCSPNRTSVNRFSQMLFRMVAGSRCLCPLRGIKGLLQSRARRRFLMGRDGNKARITQHEAASHEARRAQDGADILTHRLAMGSAASERAGKGDAPGASPLNATASSRSAEPSLSAAELRPWPGCMAQTWGQSPKA